MFSQSAMSNGLPDVPFRWDGASSLLTDRPAGVRLPCPLLIREAKQHGKSLGMCIKASLSAEVCSHIPIPVPGDGGQVVSGTLLSCCAQVLGEGRKTERRREGTGRGVEKQREWGADLFYNRDPFPAVSPASNFFH